MNFEELASTNTSRSTIRKYSRDGFVLESNVIGNTQWGVLDRRFPLLHQRC